MINFTQSDTVAVIQVDDGKANAISHAYVEAVLEALDRAEKEAHAVVFAGRPGRFCAGFDLHTFKQGPEATKGLLLAGAQLMLRLFRFPKPVVIACTGHAIAGGALILLTGDRRIGAQGDFKIGLNETAIGMVIPDFGLELSQHRLSRRHLEVAYVQARLLEPEQAQDAGFLDEVVAPEALMDVAQAKAAELAELPRDAYAGNKKAIRAMAAARLEASLEPLR